MLDLGHIVKVTSRCYSSHKSHSSSFLRRLYSWPTSIYFGFATGERLKETNISSNAGDRREIEFVGKLIG